MTAKTVDTLDNPFSRFGIKHLSATSMLQFRNDSALGIVYLVLGIREAGSPAMHRGTAVDEAIGSLLTQSIEPDLNQLKRVATKKYRALIEGDPEHFNGRYVEQELRVLLRCLDVCFPLMCSWEQAFCISTGDFVTNRWNRGSSSGFHRLALSERSARAEIHCEAKKRDHSGPRVPGLNLCNGYPAGDW